MPWPFLVAIVVLAAVALFSHYLDRKRRELLAGWVRERGWSLRHGPVRGWEREYPGQKLFTKGHSRAAKNVITGEHRGRPVKLLDYRYVTGSGKNRQTHKIGVVVVAVGHPVIPLAIRRENPFDKLGEFLGADDIDFESAEFSRRFFVTSSDRKWAYDVIHQRTMDYLLRADFRDLAFGFGELVVHRKGHFDPAGYEAALDFAADLIDLIPDYVVRQMKGEDR